VAGSDFRIWPPPGIWLLTNKPDLWVIDRFLEAYDPELHKDLGVWYTPPEIVQYMVARVDAILRSELGLADGTG